MSPVVLKRTASSWKVEKAKILSNILTLPKEVACPTKVVNTFFVEWTRFVKRVY